MTIPRRRSKRLTAVGVLAEVSPYCLPRQYAAWTWAPGSTHAWPEVYVPGAGWINFDPTNRSIGGFNLVPVAVARDITLLMPVSGSYMGAVDAFAEMEVEVRVS